MESDKYICVCENAAGNMVVIDLAEHATGSANAVQRRPIKAEAAIMNPVSKVLALRGPARRVLRARGVARARAHPAPPRAQPGPSSRSSTSSCGPR